MIEIEKSTISMVLWGNFRNENWYEWYLDSQNLFSILGYRMTHLGVIGDAFRSKGAVTVARKEKAILAALKRGEKPSSFSCFSLPKDFRTVAYDYDVHLVRDVDENFIFLTINFSDFSEEKEKAFLELMGKHFITAEGEIYQMDRSETPLMYAFKEGPLDRYQSLRVLKKIRIKEAKNYDL